MTWMKLFHRRAGAGVALEGNEILFAAAIGLMLACSPAFGQNSSDQDKADAMRRLMYPSETKPRSAIVRAMDREQRDRELSVKTRASPSYDPQHLRVGQFIVFPMIEAFTEYSDNVYATDQNKEADFLYGVRPELEIKSDFSLHSLVAKFYAEDGSYRKLKEEDYRDYGASLDARYDMAQGFALPLKLGYQKQHSRRDDPEDRRSIDPTVFDVYNAQTGIRMSGQRVDASIITAMTDYRYDDTTSFSGTAIDNSDRDRTVITNTATIGFASESIIAPFIYGLVKSTTYDRKTDNFGINRDSEDIEGGIGTFLNLSRVTKSFFKIGKVQRTFDDSSLDTFNALTYDFNLNWEPSTLAAFTLSGKRGIEETASNASSNIESELTLSMLYELAPNILLEPEIGYISRDYEGSDTSTSGYKAGIEMTYKLNPNIWTSLKYQGIREEAEGTSLNYSGYDNNIVSLSLKFQL